jgi:phosphate transport system substrate-binding protein
MEDVLRGDYSEKMKQMNGNSQITEAIMADKTGIGYVGLGHAKNSKGLRAVKVAKKEGSEYVDPLGHEAIFGGKYPILRTLNQYTNGKPSGRERDFIKFELSPEGQKIMEEAGFIPVPKEYAEYNSSNAGV